MIAEVETRHGKMFLPDTDNAQYGWLKLTGASAEDEHIDAVCALLDERPRGVAVDVGANFGCWTLPLALHAEAVLSLEPQRPVCELLARSVAANRLGNVDVRRLAAGASPGKTIVPVLDLDAPSNFGGVTLGMAHHEQPSAPTEEVEVAALDDLLLDGSGRKTSFVKIDAEGAELGIIAGARRIVWRDKPILFVEVVHRFSDAAALKNIIESLGYATEACGPNLLGVPL